MFYLTPQILSKYFEAAVNVSAKQFMGSAA